mmetsp:Transcript_37590/g.107642  ORF Transcript_37590/g.107642 Transcript_37590/m.107642 type:complete len:237 (-) Transcript_37590:433-1143(-)
MEHLPQGVAARIVHLAGDDLQRNLFEPVGGLELLHSVDQATASKPRRFRCLLLDPTMLQRVLGRHPAALANQQLSDQLLSFLRDVLPRLGAERILHLHDPLQNCSGSRPRERNLAAEQDVHYHPAAPHVAQLVVGLLKHLGGHVVGRTQASGQHLAPCDAGCQTKINYLDDVRFDRVVIEAQKVLRFQIPVSDAERVHIIQALDNLLDAMGGLNFREMHGADNSVEQLTSAAHLHD